MGTDQARLNKLHEIVQYLHGIAQSFQLLWETALILRIFDIKEKGLPILFTQKKTIGLLLTVS